MSDVFVSYARSTAAQAQHVAEALRALGYRVWRDDELPAHRSYVEVIEERLSAAKAVVVLWSEEAVKSEWVQSEADRARKDRKLVQLTLDGAPLPMPFDRIECADLTGWAGERDSEGWRKVVASVAELAKVEAPDAGTRPAAARKLAICVLPFANMSGDPEQEYFSDGISEDIITDLSKVSALSVVSRNSAFQFKGRHVDVRQVARQLDVGHVLEGSVRKAGARVRITAQLIAAEDDSHLWAERYDRDLTDIFAVQDEISQAIVAALRLKLLPSEKSAIARRGTSNPDAYNLYLMARSQWVSGNAHLPALETMARLAQRATEIDPDYADAWALWAQAQLMMELRYGVTADGLGAAERALVLDADLAEPHAIKAIYLSRQGRGEEARAEIDLALRLNPESFEVNTNAGYLAFREQRLEDAVRYYEAASALMDVAFGPAAMLITCYSALGDETGKVRAARMTLERAEKAVAEDRSNGHAMGFAAGAVAALGDKAKTLDWISRALSIDPENRVMRYNLACALGANFDDIDGTIELLTPYLKGATRAELDHVSVDPDMDPVRDDPRFKTLFAERAAQVS